MKLEAAIAAPAAEVEERERRKNISPLLLTSLLGACPFGFFPVERSPLLSDVVKSGS